MFRIRHDHARHVQASREEYFAGPCRAWTCPNLHERTVWVTFRHSVSTQHPLRKLVCVCVCACDVPVAVHSFMRMDCLIVCRQSIRMNGYATCMNWSCMIVWIDLKRHVPSRAWSCTAHSGFGFSLRMFCRTVPCTNVYGRVVWLPSYAFAWQHRK